MKTALCLSGRWNEHCHQKWMDRTQEIIPHDKMFTGTWKGQDYDVDYYFDDPENLYVITGNNFLTLHLLIILFFQEL